MINTMAEISEAFVEMLKNNTEFNTLCDDTFGANAMTYYVHVDVSRLEVVKLPYFSVVTYNSADKFGEDNEVLIQMLTGMDREDIVEDDNTFTEYTQKTLETITRKALEVIIHEIVGFGINGEKGFIKEYLNIHASPPMGEDDIQLQIDMILNTKKCL